jgi:predicted DNA-binding transcriptional regulator AlpA
MWGVWSALGRTGRRDRRDRSEAREPFPKECLESFIEHRVTNLQKQVRAIRRPTHRLALSHSLVYQMIHSRLRRSARYPKPIAPGFAVVG